MSVQYDYDKPGTHSPDLDGIYADVMASAMTNKSLEYMRWDADTGILKVVFETALDAGDKTILDGIVDSYSAT